MGEAIHYPERLPEPQSAFRDQEAAKVCLLLEYLSGRSAIPSCASHGAQLSGRMLQGPVDRVADCPAARACQEIESDLVDPTRLAMRTARIACDAAPANTDFAADIAFLMRARHCLNAAASPASAVTIAFTAMVIGKRYTKATQQGISNVAIRAFPLLEAEAERLNRSIQAFVCTLIVVLLITGILSAYTAWGKVMLDTLDAVRHDAGAVQNELAVKAPENRSLLCANTGSRPDICNRWDDIGERFAVTIHHLETWERPLRGSPPSLGIAGIKAEWVSPDQKRVPEWATAFVSVMGNYLLPILYGILGSMAFVLRRFHNKLGSFLLTPRDRSANEIRWVLGALIGSSIGLVYSSSAVAQASGILGAAATLSTSALAFLAGYGVEGVFKALDTLIVHVFRVDGIALQQQAPR